VAWRDVRAAFVEPYEANRGHDCLPTMFAGAGGARSGLWSLALHSLLLLPALSSPGVLAGHSWAVAI